MTDGGINYVRKKFCRKDPRKKKEFTFFDNMVSAIKLFMGWGMIMLLVLSANVRLGANIIKLFTVVIYEIFRNTLECLSVANLFSLV